MSIPDYEHFAKPVYISELLYVNNLYDDGIDLGDVLENNAVLVTTETNGSPKLGINTTAVAHGHDHASAIRANLVNKSRSPDGNTAVYANAMSTEVYGWQAALHGEVRHQNGTSIGCNVEVANYSVTGNLYGVVINNVSRTSNPTHPVTGSPIQPSRNSVALKILDDGSQWDKGVEITGRFKSDKALSIDYGSIYLHDDKVIGYRVKGWQTPTTPTRREALSEIASLKDTIRTLNTLIRDLQSHGLIGE